MKINNINNSLRQAIFESFTNGFEFKSNEFKSMMLKLKATNYNEYYKLACNLYPVFYIMNEDRGFNIDELNDIMTEDLLESGFDDDEIKLKEIFAFKQTGIVNEREVDGEFIRNEYIPKVYGKIVAKGIDTLKDIFE